MVLNEEDERFCVKPSNIPAAGYGLFAKVPLRQGDRLEVIGVFVAAGSVSDRCTQYADCYKFRVGELLLIPFGYAGMVNHSNRPNLEKIVDGEKVYLRAIRAISAGEELLFTYGPGYFEAVKLDPATFDH